MKLPALLFLLAVRLLAAQGASEIYVRVLTFEKAGFATALEAARPESDETLFAALTAGAAAGQARVVMDTEMSIRSGRRAKTEALREFPYPTEYDSDASRALIVPTSFTWRNLGQTFEAEATAGEAGSLGYQGRLLDLNLAPEKVTMALLNPWPMPDLRGAGRNGRVMQPVFATHKSQGQVLSATGLTTLISVAPTPQAVLAENPESLFWYTFLRAGLNGEKPLVPADIRPHIRRQRRLHAVSIRLPRDEAAILISRHDGEDEALFTELSARITAGDASLSNHTAILCREGRRAKVESIVEFPVPIGDKDVPDAWGFQNLGSSLEAETDGQFSNERTPVSGGWNLDLDLGASPEMVEYHPDASRPALHGAAFEYVRRQFTTQVTIPPSGVLCAGVLSTSPATDDETRPDGSSDICFVLQSPPPEKTEAEVRGQVLLHALLLSVPATEAPALAGSGSGKPAATSGKAAALLQRLGASENTCAAHAAVIVQRGMKSKAYCMRQAPQPGNFKPSRASPELKIPTSWDSALCGVSVEVEYFSETDDITLNAIVAWDTAPVLPFGEPGAEIPDMAARRSVERIALKALTLPPDKPVIANVRPSKAREGTPEHGRWHVLILKATPSP
jgi:hypothetical protein